VPRGLHLASFCSDLPWPTGMLDALPAHSLTRLDINLRVTQDSGPALASSTGKAQPPAAAVPRVHGTARWRTRRLLGCHPTAQVAHVA
jgi:hypothetical protein